MTWRRNIWDFLEVKVRGIKVVYSEENINMVFGLRNVSHTYQNPLETFDEAEYDVYMKSLCNPGTKWIDLGADKMARRMDF